MSKVNVLIFPAGENNSVELHNALSHNVNVEVFGTSSIERHGKYVFKNYRAGLPMISEENFISEFNKLLDEWKIDFVFPTHDTIALYLAEHQIELNTKVIVASYETALICRDKKKTYELFADCDFCLERYLDFQNLPVFIKPREGQGAVGAKLVKSMEDIPSDFVYEEMIISEYLPGKELTVDCLTDSKGNLCACLPRVRNRLMAGICVAGSTLETTDEIKDIANKINERLDLFGLWYFQLKQDSAGRYKLLEISTRCAGTMCLSRSRGVNLPLLSIYAAMGKSITVFENPYSVQMDRILISRYFIDYEYNTVYVDYDDTVIEQSKVCIPLVSFLYQCKNNNKRVVLLTRHEEDHSDTIAESLKKHAISERLFDEIITLSFEQRKSDYINGKKSIFIDNAYIERKDVHDRIGIPVFDVEGVEILMDWRC